MHYCLICFPLTASSGPWFPQLRVALRKHNNDNDNSNNDNNNNNMIRYNNKMM